MLDSACAKPEAQSPRALLVAAAFEAMEAAAWNARPDTAAALASIALGLWSKNCHS
jgi:hypothetical protein